MRFDLSFYEEVIRPADNRKLKYKFEAWLQNKELEFKSIMDKKVTPISEIESTIAEVDSDVSYL